MDSNYKFEIIEELSIFIEKEIESLFIKVYLPNKNPKNDSKNNFIIVGNFYKAPDIDFDIFYSKFSDIIDNLQRAPYKGHDHFLVGDFNINLIEHDKREQSEYLNLLAHNKYLPKILLPTRVQDRSATLIDHIFTNSKQTGTSGIIEINISDHFPVFFIQKLFTRKCKPEIDYTYKQDSSEENKKKFINLVKNNDRLKDVLAEKHPDLKFEKYFRMENYCSKQAMPIKKKRVLVNKSEANPWINSEVLELRKKRLNLYRKKNKNPTEANCNKYKECDKIYNKLKRNTKAQFNKNEFNIHYNNARATWKLLNNLLQTKSKKKDEFPETFVSDNKTYKGKDAVSEGFNDFFLRWQSHLKKIAILKNT